MNLKEFKVDLDSRISNSEQVFLVPHLGVDFDAMASCIAMALIVKKFGKKGSIIIDEEAFKIESGVKIIIDEIRKDFDIINLDKYRQKRGDNDLLITLDVNKSYMVCCENDLDNFSDIIIVDHHKEDKDTIKSNCKFIDISKSSVSEIMTELLCLYSIKYDKRIADYLLAGIYLDTNRLMKNASAKTMKIVSKLMERGADLNKVNKLFEADFLSDRKVQNLVDKANFFTFTLAVCIADEDVIYTKEELAKVADYLLNYKADAGFALGYIDAELISISARSKGNVDVGEVMKLLGGGGNIHSAATKIEGKNVFQSPEGFVRKLVPDYLLIDKK